MSNSRIESDSMGELKVDKNALYGAQTQRAINNFAISGTSMPKGFILALIQVKKCAAKANCQLDLLSEERAKGIIQVCETLANMPNLMQHFPVDIFQTGSGTSTNMNANEVIAHLANQSLKDDCAAHTVHPNDHVNFGQSSNDVIPSCIHVSAALALHSHLLPALEHAVEVIEYKAQSLSHVSKTGRTHLMDAMPVRMDQCLMGWASQLSRHVKHLKDVQPSLHELAIGGTAVGTGINTHEDFSAIFCQQLSADTGLEFSPAQDYFAAIGSQDTAVILSGIVKSIAVTLMKVSNDLRWMNSGPLAGIGEISLTALQPGSSIMPGKVNPVIPEAVAMACAQVIGNDLALTVGGQSGNFELNVMLPIIADNLLTNIYLMSNSLQHLADKAIRDFSVNEDVIAAALQKNPILVTALNPIIGYEKAAQIAKRAYQQKRPVIEVAIEMTELSKSELEKLLDPLTLTKGGL